MIRPKVMHRYVLDLCRQIAPDQSPLVVPVTPDPGTVARECFWNVSQKCGRDGGDIQHGWAIWELPGLFIEAEFHAVWLNGGQLIDVTPKEDGENDILFLPDPIAKFDEATFSRRDNVRLAELDHPKVAAYIKACEDLFLLEEAGSVPGDPSLFMVERAVHDRCQARKSECAQDMTRIPQGRYDMCRCGSAKKFKFCCGSR